MNAFWIRSSNVGDILTPFILEKMTGEVVEWTESSPKIIASGSILYAAKSGDTLIGTGSFHGVVVPPNLIPLFVRGPRTAAMLGRNDIPHGDAGLLAPLISNPDVEKIYDWGVVAHYVDEPDMPTLPEGTLRIPVSLSPQMFITALLCCKNIASSSLHGIILAEAYGVPAVRVSFGRSSDKIRDFDFKHADYYEGTGRDLPAAVHVGNGIEMSPVAFDLSERIAKLNILTRQHFNLT